MQRVETAFLAREVSIRDETKAYPVAGINNPERQIAEPRFAKLNFVTKFLDRLRQPNFDRLIRSPEGLRNLSNGFSFCAKACEVL